MLTRANGRPTAYYSVADVTPEPEQLEGPSQDRAVNLQSEQLAGKADLQPSYGDLQPEISRKFTDILPQLEAAIRQGRGKTEALKTLGLGGRYYGEASKVWDELVNQIAKE